VAFIVDVFNRKIVGWKVSSRLTNYALPLPEFEIATFMATHVLEGVIHQNDHGYQRPSLKYSHQIAEPGVQASAGSTERINQAPQALAHR